MSDYEKVVKRYVEALDRLIELEREFKSAEAEYDAAYTLNEQAPGIPKRE